ncbi:ATP-dependent DNA helicase RecQ-like [Argopecten irradians]|uniref:ATP-dependent DNA helicase RecQ-like n=1 Tax=Argopecten irradians TaxID=31199 RepID=UPI0037199FEB
MASPFQFSSVLERFAIPVLQEFQKKSFEALLEGRDVYLSVKTGGGKSLCYQAFQQLWTEKNDGDSNCAVLVISPLVSIMKEQSDFLESRGFRATYIGKDSSEDNDISQSCHRNGMSSWAQPLISINIFPPSLKSSHFEKVMLIGFYS